MLIVRPILASLTALSTAFGTFGSLASDTSVVDNERGLRNKESRSACQGSGGGVSGTGNVSLVYAYRMDSLGVDLEVAVLVRAPAEWHRLPPPDQPPRGGRPGAAPIGSGGSAGPMWVQHERDSNVVWLGEQRVPLGEANILLVDASQGEDLRVVGTARVAPRLVLDEWACRPPQTREEQESFERALWTVIRQAPAARAHLGDR